MSDATTEEIPYKRPWLTVLLTLAVPGLGHAYLRRWGRALLWFLLLFATVGTLVPEWVQATSFSEVRAVAEGVSPAVGLLLFGAVTLCVVDAYVMSLQHNRRAREARGETTARCPNCGKELDGDLDFCHWCTTKLDDSDW